MIRIAGLSAIVASAACRGSSTPTTPRAADSGFVSVPGARLFYKAVGSGDPILVVHGGPGMDHTYLLPGMLPLARSNRVVFYDQRGSGRTEGDVTETTVTFTRFLSDIDALIDTLGLGRPVMLAHSWGGLVSMRYAARSPDRLRALVLMNTAEPGRRYSRESNRMVRERMTKEDSAEISRLVLSPGFKERDTAWVNPMFRVLFRGSFADRSLANQLAINLDPRTAKNMSSVATFVMGSLGSTDVWAEAAGIKVPTLILQGAEDNMPMAMLRELARTIPEAELSVIEGAGHFPYIEKPDQTFATIRAFLSRTTKPERVPFTVKRMP